MLPFLGVFSVMLACTSPKKTPKEKNDFEKNKNSPVGCAGKVGP
jgi:hypothetical protein